MNAIHLFADLDNLRGKYEAALAEIYALKAQLATAERIIEFKDRVITAIETRAEAAEARADAAEAGMEEMRKQRDRAQDAQSDLFTARLAAESAAQRMRSALEAVEWVGSFISCPWCRGEEHNGHYADCQRQLALADRKKPVTIGDMLVWAGQATQEEVEAIPSGMSLEEARAAIGEGEDEVREGGGK